VVTIAGDLVGEYEVAYGMSVSTLRDKIANSRGCLPFTLKRLWGTDILDDEFELSDIVRQTIVDGSPLTLLHATPTVGAGAFSKVWDTLGHVANSMESIGARTPAHNAEGFS